MSLPSYSGNSRKGKNLLCGICHEVYRSPRLLPCSHTFCLRCLDGMVRARGTSFPCPACREGVNVPPGGVHHFKVNFYITEDELEQEREADSKSYCTTHPTEELIFFCKVCDHPTCIRCKLTDHEHGSGSNEDLSKTAARCREKLKVNMEQLRRDVKKVTMLSASAQTNIKSVKLRADLLKDQIHSQYSIIVSLASKCRYQALRDLDQMTQTITQELTTDVQTVQQYLDTLIQLEQRINHAMGRNNHADVVYVEKDLREDGATVQQFKTMEQKLPSTTQFPSITINVDSLKFEDIKAFIGSPVKMHVSMPEAPDVVTPVYQCQSTEGGKKVPYLRTISHLPIKLALNFRANNVISIQKDRKLSETSLGVKIVSVWNGTVIKDSKKEIMSGISNPYFQLIRRFKDNKITVNDRSNLGGQKISINKVDTPVGFDTDERGNVFAVVSETLRHSFLSEEPISTNTQSTVQDRAGPGIPGNNKVRSLQMYLSGQSDPVCSYTPPQQPFFPTAVCFCHINEQELLLIADIANDSIHLVNVANNQFRFVRYLACGLPYMVRPTSLFSRNASGTCDVWIGCENGKILKCQPLILVNEDAGDAPDKDGSDSVYHDAATDSDNCSTTTPTSNSSGRLLDVHNGSSVTISSLMSDVSSTAS